MPNDKKQKQRSSTERADCIASLPIQPLMSTRAKAKMRYHLVASVMSIIPNHCRSCKLNHTYYFTVCVLLANIFKTLQNITNEYI